MVYIVSSVCEAVSKKAFCKQPARASQLTCSRTDLRSIAQRLQKQLPPWSSQGRRVRKLCPASLCQSRAVRKINSENQNDDAMLVQSSICTVVDVMHMIYLYIFVHQCKYRISLNVKKHPE